MSNGSKHKTRNFSGLGSKVPPAHPVDIKPNPPLTPEQHKFRIRQLMLTRLRVEFPMHDIADLGLVVQRMWNDIETDTEAVEPSKILTRK